MHDTQLASHFQSRRDQLFDLLYNCAANPDHWQHFLRELVSATDSRSARLLLLNQSGNRVLHSAKVNIDDGDHLRYLNHYVNTCPWRLELNRKPRGQLYSTYYDFSCRQPEFYRSEFFNDWAKALDIHHGICGTIYQTEEQKVQLLVQRTQGQGHYSPLATRLVNGLLPHVRQALRLGQQFQMQTEEHQSATTAAEHCALPFILLDKNCRVVHISPHCETLLQQGELSLTDGQLVPAVPAVQQRFQQAFAAVSDGAEALVAKEVALNIRRAGRPTLKCLLTPIHPAANQLRLWPANSYVALYIFDPEQALCIDPQALALLYNLTESEARIAIDIARGLDPRFIAERDNRSPHTIRSQLKSVFNKTRCRRQNQLAALILQSPAVRRS